MNEKDYGRGDTVIGRFSCTNRVIREQAVVTARFTEHGHAAFIGINPSTPTGIGSGVWGYDNEIDEIVPAPDSSGDA